MLRITLRKAAAVVLLLAVAATASATTDVASAFAQFKVKYGKSYISADEEARRFEIFAANMKEAARLAALNPHATFGVNGFSDVSATEFKVKHSGEATFRAAVRRRASRNVAPLAASKDAVASNPKMVDWRTKGVVTPIKNQLACGGCWSFSTTGNIEGQWAIAGHGLVSLSEQELVSCTDTCNGCHGGIMDDAFEWLVNTRNGGITSEAQYPFVSGEGVVPACATAGKTPVAFISSFVDVAHDEQSMANFVATKGPLSIAVDSTSFQTYTGGVMTNCVANQVDHAILIVGYNLEAATPYWIVKNQWGTTWGEQGYIYLAYGQNECLLTTLPSSSVVSNPPPVPPTGTPAPPSPPDTTGGSFTQNVCSSSTCTTGCTPKTLPNGKCLSLSSGGSVISSCGGQLLHLEVYSTKDCTGAWQQSGIQLNTCSQEQGGSTYIETTCTSGGSGSGSGPVAPPPAPASGSGSGSTLPPSSSSSGLGDDIQQLTAEESAHVLRLVKYGARLGRH